MSSYYCQSPKATSSSSSVPLSLFPNLQPPQITKKNETGGCYAKCIGLKAAQEPEIWKAIRFGAVLENVVFDENSRNVDFDSNAVTENTRASYPIDHIDNARIPCVGPHPRNLVLLCCDAFGVLPPVSSEEEVFFFFLSFSFEFSTPAHHHHFSLRNFEKTKSKMFPQPSLSRSPSSPRSRRCTTSSRATPRKWPARRTASRSPRRRSRRASEVSNKELIFFSFFHFL